MQILLIVSLFINLSILNAKDITIDYKVKGMMCSMNCPDYIKEGALRVDGVKKCDIDFKKKIAKITYDDSKINEDQVASILSKNTDGMYDIKVLNNETKQTWWNWLFGS